MRSKNLPIRFSLDWFAERLTGQIVLIKYLNNIRFKVCWSDLHYNRFQRIPPPMPSVPNNSIVRLRSIGAFVVQTIQVGWVTPGGKVKENINKSSCPKVESICNFSANQKVTMLLTAQSDSCKNLHLWTSVPLNVKSLIRGQLQVLIPSLKQKVISMFSTSFLTSVGLWVLPANLFQWRVISESFRSCVAAKHTTSKTLGKK